MLADTTENTQQVRATYFSSNFPSSPDDITKYYPTSGNNYN